MGSRISLTICAIALGFLVGVCVPAGEWFGVRTFEELILGAKILIYVFGTILAVIWFIVFFRQPY